MPSQFGRILNFKHPRLGWERILAPTLFVIVLLESLLRLLPWQYATVPTSLEAESWVRVLQEAFLDHRAFGGNSCTPMGRGDLPSFPSITPRCSRCNW